MTRRSNHIGTAIAACAILFGACAQERAPQTAVTESLGPDERATYEFVVPFGTSNRIDGGEIIEIMPETLHVKVGESIRITNQDRRTFEIGPFMVGGGQTLAMRFTNVGRLSGICEINAGREFVIEVTK
jgi:hypothetical protein